MFMVKVGVAGKLNRIAPPVAKHHRVLSTLSALGLIVMISIGEYNSDDVHKRTGW